MDKCKKCSKNISVGNLFVCPNCGTPMCYDCATLSKMICPVCYRNLELKG